jgi:hypothetical protein
MNKRIGTHCHLVLAVTFERTDMLGDFMLPLFKNRINIGKLAKQDRVELLIELLTNDFKDIEIEKL